LFKGAGQKAQKQNLKFLHRSSEALGMEKYAHDYEEIYTELR
jgi:hypothetical protein